MKKKKMSVVSTDLQLQNCVDSKSMVEIWVDGYLDDVGLLLDFNSDCVKINNGRYLRANCVMRTKNYFRRVI